jgi:ATP-dependent helicase/DNAse subunit B
MLITYFRSSSYNTHSICPQQYFICYVLGIPQVVGIKAEKGTAVHKVLECLAISKKLYQDDKEGTFVDSAVGKVDIEKAMNVMSHDDIYVSDICRRSCDYYSKQSPHRWTPEDYRDCLNWTFMALQHKDGMFDPRNREIVDAEPFFDIPIEADWAKYEYELPNGKKIAGQLHIKGTIDLITKVSDDMYEIIDWKTGATRKDWATGEEKDFYKLCVDPQLRMYHYAVSKLYPNIPNIAVTIDYIRVGGPFSLPFGPSDIPKTLNMLKKKFKTIQATTRPALRNDWFCDRVCYYGKTMHEKDPTQTMCQYIHNKLLRIGIDETMSQETPKDFMLGDYSNPGE